MPLDQDEIDKINQIFDEIDQRKEGYIREEDLLCFFEKLKIKDILSEPAQKTVVKGLTCKGEVKVTLDIITNFYTVIKDKDDLGLLKVCMRGVTEPNRTKVNLQEAIELSTMLGIPKTQAELIGGTNNGENKNFSFSQLADIFFEIEIPQDANQFDGVMIGSKCCLII